MYGIDKYVEQWQNEQDYTWNSFWLMFGTFLDKFYKEKNIELVTIEPSFDENVPEEIKSFIASSVDYLCNASELITPKWSKDLKYVLEKPFFPNNVKGNIKAIMLIESPIEFKARNIYVTADVLSRI